jgi:hypothetical protein
MSEKPCGCRKCIKLRDADKEYIFDKEEYQRMILCPTCGFKRCPKANHHDNKCTGSNESGQVGSAYH